MPDRNLEQWQKEIDEDLKLIKTYLVEATMSDDAIKKDYADDVKVFRTQRIAMARKEARRLERDCERIAKDAYGIDIKEINEVHT